MKQKKYKTLPPTRPSIAIERKYKRKLEALIDEMQRSVYWWVRAGYRKREAEILAAEDASPARSMEAEMRRLLRQWRSRYEEEANNIARWFAQNIDKYTRASIRSAFRETGLSKFFTVNFKYRSRREQGIMSSIVAENVSLIKSIPQKYFQTIEGMVQRSIQTGRDLSTLSDEIEGLGHSTRKRAEMIARDQTDKATESFHRERMVSLGITEGIWVHTSAGKTYRESHVQMDGKKYNLAQGCYDPAVGRHIFPGELVNCRCVCAPVIPDSFTSDENQ